MKNYIYKISVIFSVLLIIVGCSSKKEEMTNEEKLRIEEQKLNCNKNLYKGKILFGTITNSMESYPSLVSIEIGNKLCTAEINSSRINYQTNKIYFTFNQLNCDGKNIIPAKGFILDSQCQEGIKANLRISEKLITDLENQLKIFQSEQLKRELLKAKIGYLESEPNQEVFIQITEPYYFMHKYQIHRFGY
ncbi:hypothetical protein L5F64_01150 [Aliarcobacter butzleri]|nr:hypothetical protein [Aliarcobacter butzleri]